MDESKTCEHCGGEAVNPHEWLCGSVLCGECWDAVVERAGAEWDAHVRERRVKIVEVER